ncbi:LuxR C-terminal-related transcriptional regulator [Ferrimonas sp. SCSIO 43195]|uniref:LuxR C-terminal-related transcriptional regulator n=1 Tax=Ferrimonas sp. SCSIO 43195 TaxID=2822844 RepID=UPI002075FCF1|nr:LuxR C-terminal-related transcriptional regulator [Ferrimonas sp. SCSIO 43195]USD37303.1 hypothetical protein J8Z22_20345 [Ferrimonas sp. SCSIO 43195]
MQGQKLIELHQIQINQLEQLLDEIAASYGFIGGLYLVSLNASHELGSQFAMTKHNRRLDFIYSNDDIRRLRKEFIQVAIHKEPNHNLYLKTNYAIFSYEGEDEATRRCVNVLKKYGVRSRLFIRLEDPYYPEFSPEFIMMSDKAPVELEQQGEQIREELTQRLDQFHQLAFASNVTSSINPLTGLGLVNDKCMEILRMLADGHSRPDIADKVFMTERGVDYHLIKLRALLNAKNNVHLISECYRRRVLDLS